MWKYTVVLFFVILWIMISEGSDVNIPYEEMTKDVHIFEGSDFEEVVKTSLFVDKTFLMKRFIDNTKHGSGILVLAPRHYGKSTNLDMLRRFFSINVDRKGQRVDVEKTVNFKIFRDNFLNIYRLGDFFKRHFGKYPVIHIDYGPLSVVKEVEEMLAVFFRKIMMDSFLQHRYIINDTFIWSQNTTYGWINRDKFELYINHELNDKLTESDVETGMSYLARLLHRRYEERVIVLIDNFDAFVESPLYAQNPNIFHFMSAINQELLRCESVERSLVTGVTRSAGCVAGMETLPSNVVLSVAKHKVWEYFGLSGAELDQLLQPVIRDDEERQKAMGRLVHEYSGYGVATFEAGEDASGQLLDTQTCSVWSVIKYMEKELAVDNFSSLV